MKTFDEQLNDHYAAFEAGTLDSWEVQLARAQAGTRLWRDVRDHVMGFGSDPEQPNLGRVVIYFTDEEVAQVQQQQQQAVPPTPAQQIVDLLVAKNVITADDANALTLDQGLAP